MERVDLEHRFVQQLNAHQGILRKVCSIYTHTPDDHEDLFQEIVLQAWRAFPAFRAEATFSTWLYRVALNVAITNLRKRTRRPHMTDWDQLSEQAVASIDPLDQTDQLQALHQAIATLNQIEKGLIMLHLEGYTYEEMADIMGITPNYVGVKLNRIREKLRKKLQAPISNPQNS